jgi:pimeloyl-ACP methyl ester carboxylesterase
VVGLVYVDPLHPRETAMGYWLAANEEELAERNGWALDNFRNQNPPPSPGLLADVDASDQFLSTPVEERGLPSDPSIPTAVILGNIVGPPPEGSSDVFPPDFLPRVMERRIGQMGQWVASMSEGALYMASDAGHFVHLDAPKLATQAVEQVLDRIQR